MGTKSHTISIHLQIELQVIFYFNTEVIRVTIATILVENQDSIVGSLSYSIKLTIDCIIFDCINYHCIYISIIN